MKTLNKILTISVIASAMLNAQEFNYKPNQIYHIQDQFNGDMLKQYLNLPAELGAWYNQNTHQIHLTPVNSGGKTYYKITSGFNAYISAPNNSGEPLTLNSSNEDRQLWEFVPHTTADGRDYGFYYLRNKATGEYLYDNVDPTKDTNLRQANRGFDLSKNQSYPTTKAMSSTQRDDRRFLWRIDPTETQIPATTLSVPESGWTPNANKIAVLGVTNALGGAPEYRITDKNGNELYRGRAIAWGRYWSNHSYYILNLNIPQLEHEGDYKVYCNGLERNIFIRNDVLLHPLRQNGSDRFDLKEIFDPNFGFVTQWGRLTSWWPRAYDWLQSLNHWDWILSKAYPSRNINRFPHWMWRDIWDDNGNGNHYENLPSVASYDEANDCLNGGWEDTDTFAHNYAIDGQVLDELAQLYRNTTGTELHNRIYNEILYGVIPMLKRQESDGQWRMGYMDQQHWSGTTAALGMGLAAVLPIIQERDASLASQVKNALDKTWSYMLQAKDNPSTWAVPNEGIMYDGNILKGFVGNQRTMWREAYLMLAVNMYLATDDDIYKDAVEAEILSGHIVYNGWMHKNPSQSFAGQFHTNSIYALLAMLRYYDKASDAAKAHIKKLSKDFYNEYVVSNRLIGGPFGNYSKRRIAEPGGVDAWHIWEYMTASTHLYKHFGDEFGEGMLLSQRALDWYWGANPYSASLMQGVGERFMNYGWSSPHTIGRHMGLNTHAKLGYPFAMGTDGDYPMSEATVASSISIWNSIALMQKYDNHKWVKVYSKSNYTGTYSSLTTGKYTLNMLKAYGIKDIHSIKVPEGYTVKLYAQNNFAGGASEYGSDTSNISGAYQSIEIDYLKLDNMGKIINVAEGTDISGNGQATQSTTYPGYPATKAIDNNTNNFTHTDLSTPNNYWQLLLNASYSIGKIEIFNRANYGARLNGCVVKVLDENKKVVWSSQPINNATNGGKLEFNLPEKTVGRYIKIGLEGNSKNGFGDYVVSLAEVKVYAGVPSDNNSSSNGNNNNNNSNGNSNNNNNNNNSNGNSNNNNNNGSSGNNNNNGSSGNSNDNNSSNVGDVVDISEGIDITNRGQASQSTLYPGYPASKGVDGDRNSFSHTNLSSPGNYWQLELNGNYSIGKIEIFNRAYYGARLNGCVVKVLDENKNVVWSKKITNATDSGKLVFNLPEKTVGKYIKIGLEGNNKNAFGDYVVTVAEVKVYSGVLPDSNSSSNGNNNNNNNSNGNSNNNNNNNNNNSNVANVPVGTYISSNGQASQSTTFPGYPASKGVDGDRNSFSHTDLYSPNNYWQLELNNNYSIGKIEIFNRNMYGVRLNGCVLKVIDENKNVVWSKKITNATDGGKLVFNLPEKTVGKYIKIGLEGNSKNAFGDYVVTVAEVKVYSGVLPDSNSSSNGNNNNNNNSNGNSNNNNNNNNNSNVANVPVGTYISSNGQASQSTTFPGYPASKGVDGDRNSFSHTDLYSPNNYWQLELNDNYSIGKIEIFNRAMYGVRLNGCLVKVLDENQNVVWSKKITGATDGGKLVFNLPEKTVGKYIKIGLEGNSKNAFGDYVVTVAEVKVYSGVLPDSNSSSNGNNNNNNNSNGNSNNNNNANVANIPVGTYISTKGQASQSTTFPGYPASKGVDGDRNSFSHTDLTSPNNYWQLELNDNYSIGKIKIFNRAMYGVRLNGCVLKVLDENQNVVWSKKITGATDGGKLVFNLPEKTVGKYIKIGLEGNTKNAFGDYVVTVAEVKVYSGVLP